MITLKTINESGEYNALELVGVNRNSEIGLLIDTQKGQSIIIESVTITNVFIPIIKVGDGDLYIKGGVHLSKFGGDAINIRGSNITIGGAYIVRDNTPTRPYNTCYQNGIETISECLERHGEVVYDPALLKWEIGADGRRYLSGYHTDALFQSYAVQGNAYTIDPNGVIENIQIPHIDAKIKGFGQGVMCSERCEYKNFILGTNYLHVICEYPYPFVFNSLSDSKIGNSKAMLSGPIRIENVKRSRYASRNNIIQGISVIGDIAMKTIFDPIKHYPELTKDGKRMTLGYRHNNPGNIKDVGIAWQGMVSNPSERLPFQQNPEFCVFVHPKFGIRAIVKDLLTKQKRYRDCKSIRGIMNRYAPKGNENPHQEEYIYFIARKIGVGHKDTISVRKYKTVKAFVKAIMLFENGRALPYGDDLIDEALLLAGINMPGEEDATKPKPASASNGIKKGTVVVGGTTVAAATKVNDIVTRAAEAADEAGIDVIKVITWGDIIIIGLLAVIAFAAVDWILDRRLTSAMGIK